MRRFVKHDDLQAQPSTETITSAHRIFVIEAIRFRFLRKRFILKRKQQNLSRIFLAYIARNIKNIQIFLYVANYCIQCSILSWVAIYTKLGVCLEGLSCSPNSYDAALQLLCFHLRAKYIIRTIRQDDTSTDLRVCTSHICSQFRLKL